jgi:hypothetical protein
MATTKVTPVQLLRSQVLNKRPDPAQLLLGQPAVNINPDQPGLFFKDTTPGSGQLFKVGPCYVGDTPPNDGATGAPGQLGNTLGELWLDTNGDPPLFPGPVLKVWGSRIPGNPPEWINCFPPPTIYAVPVVSDTTPSLMVHPDGTLWWDSGTGLMYILYNDGTTRQWTQISSNTVL